MTLPSRLLRPAVFSFAAAFVLSLSAGCSSKSINESNPKALYEDAEQDAKDEHYLLALDKLKIVKSKFSYSIYGALAQLKIGDVYFAQESYAEAAAAYQTFYELYPKHEKAGYALFRQGESYFKDVPSKTERDLRSAQSAIAAFDQYLKRFPAAENVKQAAEMRKKAYDTLAEKELHIAEFYLRRNRPDNARIRLQRLLDQYGESSSAEKAKELLRKL